MSGGGKQSTSTSAVTIPPEVLARYNSVNQTAQNVAQTPFQTYGGEFVAPVNSTQQAGINQTSAYAAAAQPYNAAAAGYTVAGANPVNPTPLTSSDINQYLSPYLGDVAESTEALVNQQNQQAQEGQLGNAISEGAFGGDRAGLAAAALSGQQELAGANIYSGILNTGYNTALSTAQQQQGVGLGAAQANREALQQTGQSLEGLGSTVQTEGLGGAQAEIGAGTTAQQTQQAQDTAEYNQFLQQQSYPFQVTQFLANIAEGTGALSGSTTTTTQPQSIFSDERLKEGIEPIGKTFDGQNIVRFRYKGEPTTHIGLIAQDVERDHPQAVGLAAARNGEAYKTVDYDRATDASADRGHFRRGGLAGAANDNAVPMPQRARRQAGGVLAYGTYPEMPGVSPYDLGAILEAQARMYAPYSANGLYGSGASGSPRGGGSYVPSANLPVSHLAVASPPRMQQPSTLQDIGSLTSLAETGDKIYNQVRGVSPGGASWSAPTLGPVPDYSDVSLDGADLPTFRRGGLALAGRKRRDDGGDVGDAEDQPYGPVGLGLDIPDAAPSIKPLQPAPPPQGQQANPLGDIAEIGGDIAKILPLIMTARRGGGRIHRDDGGDVGGADYLPIDDDIAASPIVPQLTVSQMEQGLRPRASPGDSDALGAALAGAAGGADTPSIPAAGLALTAPPPRTPGLTVSQMEAGLRPRPTGGSARRSSPGLGAASVAPLASITAPPPSETADPVGSATGMDTSVDGSLAPPIPAPSRLAPFAPSGPGDGDSGPAASGLGAAGSSILHGLGSKDFWIPLLSGLAETASVPTVHPLVALAQGLGAGANSYLGVKQREAQIAQEQASAQLGQAQAGAETGIGLLTGVPSNMQGYVRVAGPDPHGNTLFDANGRPFHYELAVNAANSGASPSAPQGPAGAVAQATKHGAFASDYANGQVHVVPSSQTDAAMERYGITPGAPGIANTARLSATNPALAQAAQAEDAESLKEIGDVAAARTNQQNMGQLGVALGSLPNTGFSTVGAGFEQRQQLANLLATSERAFGLTPDPSLTGPLDNAQIVEKIKALQSGAIAAGDHIKAAYFASMLQGVLPGGNLQKPAMLDIWANMMSQGQKPLDLNDYRNAYLAQYGTAAGLRDNFSQDVRYDSDVPQLVAMVNKADPSKPSMAEYLTAHPKALKAFEARYGTGTGRYWLQ